jgi:hypothetical protein
MNNNFPTLNVLLVEDEDTKIAEWNDAVLAHNVDVGNKGFYVESISRKTAASAKHSLEMHSFDAIVIDLRLQLEEGVLNNNSDGNDVLKYVVENQPIGVVIYTGQQGDADFDANKSPQVEVMDKGDGLYQVFEWLSTNKEVFLGLRGARAAISRETAKIFYRSIWPRWAHWNNGYQGASGLTEVVARHVVAHVHDALLHAGGEVAHPEESYFVPPLKPRLDTGDLVRDQDGIVWVVVTPRCDLANSGKVNTILLAQCEDISSKWETGPNVSGTKEKNMKKLIQHEAMPKQHFLFPMRDVKNVSHGPWMVQFHHLKALPLDEAITNLTSKRFASISPMFIPSLVERFGAYFSRIGTPNYSAM